MWTAAETAPVILGLADPRVWLAPQMDALLRGGETKLRSRVISERILDQLSHLLLAEPGSPSVRWSPVWEGPDWGGDKFGDRLEADFFGWFVC